MGEFYALDAITASNPTEQQWIVRAAAKLLCEDAYLRAVERTPHNARAAAILASSQLATDAAFYLADITPMAWARLAADILICVEWADREGWSF